MPLAKTPYFVNLSFNFTLQLINAMSSDLQKLLRFVNGTAIVSFYRIQVAAAVYPINLVLYLKDLKVLLPSIPAAILVVSSLE